MQDFMWKTVWEKTVENFLNKSSMHQSTLYKNNVGTNL